MDSSFLATPLVMSDAESNARRTLALGFSSSLIWGGKVFGGMLAVVSVAGGALVALKTLTGPICVALGTATFAAGIVSVVVAEIARLKARSDALREVLQAGRYYESLLTDARQERDKARNDLATLTVSIEALKEVKGILVSKENDDE